MTPSQLQPGETLGRYRIVRVLGSGAMGDVYLAEDPQIGRQLALKTVRIDGGSAAVIEERKQRLLREMRAAGRVMHPNAVTLFDTGEDRGLVFLAFEYVEGCDLQERRHRAPPLEVRDVVRFVRQTAAALAEAHRHGIVHRDIKPSNILITLAGDAKVGDFGIAKLLEGTTTDLTNTGMVVGSPQYMAPEQIRGEALDGGADQFSLGTVLYELLGRQAPFRGETITTLVYQILHQEPVDLAELRPDLAPELCAVVRRMMVKDRERRFKSLSEVVHALEAIERRLPSGPPVSSDAPTVISPLPAGGGSRAVPPPPPLASRGGAPAKATRQSGAADPAPTPGPRPQPPSPPARSGKVAARSGQVTAPPRRRVAVVLAVAAFCLLAFLVVAAIVVMRLWSAPPRAESSAASTASTASTAPPPPITGDRGQPLTTSTVPATTLPEAAPGADDSAAAATRTDLTRPVTPVPATTSVAPVVRRTERLAEPPAAGGGERPVRDAGAHPPAGRPEPALTAPGGGEEERGAGARSDRASAADPFAGFAYDAARASSLSLTFEVDPKTAFVQVRGTLDERFLSVGVADDYGAGRRKPRGLELSGPGIYLVRLRAEGKQDFVVKVTASPGGSAAPIRATLRPAGARAEAPNRYRARDGVCFVGPPRRAQATVDGAERGPARAYDCNEGTALALAPGQHTIELRIASRVLQYQVEITTDASSDRARIELPKEAGEP